MILKCTPAVTHSEELVEQEGEPVGEHLLGDGLRAPQQQFRVVLPLHRLLYQLCQQCLQDTAMALHSQVKYIQVDISAQCHINYFKTI